MKHTKYVFLILFLLCLGNATASTNGLALLKVESGARPAGMGGAVVSLNNHPDASIYNPAGSIDVTKFTISLGHVSYWDNIRMESAHFAMGMSKRVFIHGGIRFATVDNLELRGDVPVELPEGLFDLHDVSFKGGLSVKITDKINAGFSAGWILEKIEGWRGSVFNFDIGVQAKAMKNLNIGASVTDIGSEFKLSKNSGNDSRPISLPTTYRAGASYTYDKYLGAVDMVYTDDEAHLHVGAEGNVHPMFQIRAGYMFNYDTKNLTAGASFVKRNLTVDYAFVPYKQDLGSSHIINLSFSL